MSGTSTWVKFFADAGIPNPNNLSYAHIFVKNRIAMDMLMELNKEYLREMGILPMGDIISILRHSKAVADQSVRDKILAENESPRLVEKVTIPKVTSTVAFARRVLPEHEGKYKVSLPKGSTKKTREILAKHSAMQSDKMDKKSIFDRLNSKDIEMADSTSSEPKVKISKASSSIFNRLGKLEKSSVVIRSQPRKVARVVMDSDDDFSDSLEKMDSDDILNKQVKFSPKVEVRVYDDHRNRKVAARPTKATNSGAGIKSRLEMKSSSSSLYGIQKSISMKSPKRSPPIASRLSKMASDKMFSDNATVHSRLDIKHRKTNSGSQESNVFNRLGRNKR